MQFLFSVFLVFFVSLNFENAQGETSVYSSCPSAVGGYTAASEKLNKTLDAAFLPMVETYINRIVSPKSSGLRRLALDLKTLFTGENYSELSEAELEHLNAIMDHFDEAAKLIDKFNVLVWKNDGLPKANKEAQIIKFLFLMIEKQIVNLQLVASHIDKSDTQIAPLHDKASKTEKYLMDCFGKFENYLESGRRNNENAHRILSEMTRQAQLRGL